MSLSGWFRDYVYFPMGGNKFGRWKGYFALLVVFLISGFWHGANYTFIIWGLLHGTGVIAEKALKLDNPQKYFRVRNFVVIVFVGFSWIFFRSSTLADALGIINRIPVNLAQNSLDFLQSILINGPKESLSQFGIKFNNQQLLASTIGLFILALIERKENNSDLWFFINKKSNLIRWGFYFLLLGMIMLFGVYENRQFIYFQF